MRQALLVAKQLKKEVLQISILSGRPGFTAQPNGTKSHRPLQVSGQHVPACHGQQVTACHGQHVAACHGQHVAACHGQHVPACQGQQVTACHGQQVPACQGQQVLACHGQQVLACRHCPSRTIDSVVRRSPGQQYAHGSNLWHGCLSKIVACQIENVRGERIFFVLFCLVLVFCSLFFPVPRWDTTSHSESACVPEMLFDC